jgi:hypothetical protein
MLVVTETQGQKRHKNYMERYYRKECIWSNCQYGFDWIKNCIFCMVGFLEVILTRLSPKCQCNGDSGTKVSRIYAVWHSRKEWILD